MADPLGTPLLPRPGKRPADNVLAAVMAAHWAILPDALSTIVSIAERTNLAPDALEAQRGEELRNAYDVTVRDGVATIPITGPMFRYASMFTRLSGATAYEDVARDFTLALQDPRVRAIVFSIDSPGGEVNGNAELSRMVFDARGQKPITAYISNLGASAAYWLASAADEVVVAPTAIVGSIGSVLSVRRGGGADRTEIVSSQSPKKRLDPESPEGRDAIQQTVDAVAQVFIDAVAEHRGVSADTVLAEFGQGGVFVGQQAVDAGLADRVGSYESVLAELRDGRSPGRASVPATRPTAGVRASLHPENDMHDTPKPGASATPAPATPATPAAAPDPATPAATPPASPAASAAPDAATLRREAADAERARITGIQALGRPGEEKLVAECIADPSCSVADAALRLRAAEQQTAAGRLAAIQADETQGKKPDHAPSPEPSAPADQERQAAKATVALYHSLTPQRG